MKTDKLIRLLGSETTYECPADIFGHSREYLNALEAKNRLLEISNYWMVKSKKCEFKIGGKKQVDVWNKKLFVHQQKEVTIILIKLEVPFKPDFSSD